MKLIITLTLVVIFIAGCKPKTPEQIRGAQIESQFNPDSSHINLTKWIKDEMNDPDSYEHIRTRSEIRKDYTLVITDFRGKNAFGAKVKNRLYAKISDTGEVVETAKSDVWEERRIREEVRAREEETFRKIDSVLKVKKR